MKLLYSESCLSYQKTGHAESPARIGETVKFLKEQGRAFIQPEPCTHEDVLLIHSESFLENIQSGNYQDADTPVLPNMFDHALMAAGAAIQAAGYAMQGHPAFSLMRPPGHHATRDKVMGFCYLNSIAIATARYLNTHPMHRVAILDIDCHHGNGTEAVFAHHKRVRYISLHQRGIFPNTGTHHQGNSYNFLLDSGTDDSRYMDILDQAFDKLTAFKPDMLAVSMGFDTYQDDPLTDLGLTQKAYWTIARNIQELNYPFFMVMEGGYSKDLPLCVHQFLQGIA